MPKGRGIRAAERMVNTPVLFLNQNEKKALDEFSSRVKSVLDINLFDLKLFGSKSTGKSGEESDIDVLVVVNHRDDEVLDVVSKPANSFRQGSPCLSRSEGRGSSRDMTKTNNS